MNINELADKQEYFIEQLSTISREGSQLDRLVDYLCNKSDFFSAPASTKYHNSFEGGLCDHSLNVYHYMTQLQQMDARFENISDDSMRIVGLLHDFAKVNYYTPSVRNVKVYHAEGNKSDELGSFSWQSVRGYTVEDDKRFIYGNHETTSEYMIRCFIPLTVEESIAVLHHHGGMSTDCAKDNISEVYNRYPLALLLHLADMMATYARESTARSK